MGNPPPRSDTSVLLVCITVLVAIIVVGAALIYVFGPSDQDTSVIAILVSILAPTIASMVAVVKVGGVSSQVADVAEDTNKLANGLGDAKIRAAVADVLPDHMVDPHARRQLAEDRARLDRPEEHP